MSDTKSNKEFKLSSLSVNNRISVYVLAFLAVVVGAMSYTSMPKESFPEIQLPTIYVNTPYPGNSPVDMENLVTRPIEKEINTITGVKKLSSTSIQDFSIIIVEFEFDVDPKEALQEVKDAVDKSKSELPNDLPADPNVIELDFSEMPVMNVNVSGDYPYEKLKEYAEYLEEKIENLPQVSGVDISGLQEDEVEISIDKSKMESLEISFMDVENAISSENISISGGDIKVISGDDISTRNVRIDGEFKDWKNIENIIVKNEKQNIVYLRDIGEVTFGPKTPSSFARLNNSPVLALDIKKKSGENLIEAADQVKQIVADAKASYFPKDLEVVITNDQSKFTLGMVNNLENSIIMGVLLVVLVLLFFLGLRNSMFVGVAIPLSMLMGIAILNFNGNSLNMMVLFSLILALGMLVDNGIVVVENIYRLRQQGVDGETASKQGVGEVALAIISSTATTLAAFLPLLFWNELMGEFMKFLPITLIIVLASSLFVALVINPVLTADWMRVSKEELSKKSKFWTRNAIMLIIGVALWMSGGAKMLGGILVAGVVFSLLYRFILYPGANTFQANQMPKIENFYHRVISFALRGKKPILFFVGTIGILIFSLMFFAGSNPNVLFFPDNEPKMVNVFIEAPLGTDIHQTDEITRKLEQKVYKAIEKDSVIVEAVLAQVGEKTSDPNEGPQPGSSPNKARITVSFYEYEKRVFLTETKTSEIMKNIKAAVADFPEAKITIAKDNMGPPVGKPINLEIAGEDYLKLITIVEDVKNKMVAANLKGVDQLKTDLEMGKPMLEISINRDAARRFGVSTAQIGSHIRTALFGKEISKYKEGEDDYEIQLRYSEEYRYNLTNLLNTRITFRSASSGKIVQVPISAVADIDFNSTYGSVKRLDTDRVITIFSEVEEGANANALVQEYKSILADYEMPDGYTLKFTGEQEEQAKSASFLANAMLIAVGLIFLIIVSQFNSVVGPIIIMCSVLFSTIGVFLGFAIFKMPFVILMCGIGIISLAGVVVNNAIVLIDYTNLLRNRKREELGVPKGELLSQKDLLETIIEAGKTRLRPVLLTAITTVLGLIPLAIGMNINFASLLTELDPQFYTGGDNADFWGPMAWTIIFGLIFATFLTLVIVPVMYLLSDKLQHRTRKLLKRL